MAKSRFTAIVLAAGKGTRMKSPLPKVLHPVAGLPMIHRVINAVQDAGADEVRVVLGYGKDLISQVVEPLGVTCHIQTEQKGTADAVRSAHIEDLLTSGTVMIVNGDHPLIMAEDLASFIDEFNRESAELAVVTTKLKEPGSYGRIVRHNGNLRAIVEVKDASADTLKIKEINTGIYLVRVRALQKYLPQIESRNAQREFYLTDLVSLAVEAGEKVVGIPGKSHVARGVNDQLELSKVNSVLFRRKARRLMEEGVIILDPKNTYIEDSVQVNSGTVIYPGCFLRGKTKVGSFCVIEPHSFLSDTTLENSVQVRAGCYLEGAVVETKAFVGPYARLRPGTKVGAEAHVGNFVEMKNVNFGKGAKASHLTYLGDADVGEQTNIGCGTITCNYAPDKKKYRTVIGKNVFVGSDTQFIAPITIGDNSYIGSGSTITKDVPAGSLAVTRAKQVIKENYTPKSETPSRPVQNGTDKTEKE